MIFIYLSLTSKKDIAIVISIFALIVSPFIIYFKMYSNVDYSFNFTEINKDLVIYSGNANYYINNMPIGGNLYLSKDKLIFQTNVISFMYRNETTININDITKIETFDNLGFIKNGLIIFTKKNKKEKITSFKRQIWKEEIEKLMKL